MTLSGPPSPIRTKLPKLAAIAIPVLAGLLYLALANAPQQYLLIHSACLAIACLWAAIGRAPVSVTGVRILCFFLLAMLYLPLLTGPEMNGIARWVPVGPFSLNVGALVFPALAVLSARDRHYAPAILLLAIFAAFLQPDAALGFAIVFAAVGLHDVTRDWRIGLVVIIGFLASIIMALRGELPPQPFVERVIVDALAMSPWLAILMVAAWVCGFCCIMFNTHIPRGPRFTLAGALFGFIIMSLMSHYPSILIGYGAAPILGFGFALGLSGQSIAEQPLDTPE